jgi:predicted HicB family RNase H-like nuclease
MMEYNSYVAKAEFDPDARILHGEVVGIRDVVTFQGRTVDEVEKAFRGSVDDYLAFCKKRGEQPDKQIVLPLPVVRERAGVRVTLSVEKR